MKISGYLFCFDWWVSCLFGGAFLAVTRGRILNLNISRDDEPHAKTWDSSTPVKTPDSQSSGYSKTVRSSPFQTNTITEKKPQRLAKWLICELYLINTFRAGELRASNRLTACWARPHLFVYKGGAGRSSAAQKPWAYFNFSVLQFAPRLLPKKHKYSLGTERGNCFSHPLRCRWGSGNGRLDFGC